MPISKLDWSGLKIGVGGRHHCLNGVDGLENPTAENIATWIWMQMKPLLSETHTVTVYETPNCWAEYQGEV